MQKADDHLLKISLSRRIFISTLLLVLFLFGIFTVHRLQATKNPYGLCPDCNVILISVDTLRADHLPCYGYPRDTAHFICKFAEDGIIFDNFIVQGYLTPISMMSILTSQYPSRTGFTSFFSKLDISFPTLPELLHRHGYTSVAFGSCPEFMFKSPEYNMDLIQSFSKGYDRYEYTGYRTLPTDALTWLQSNYKNKFFLWLPIGTVHFPYALHGNLEDKGKFDPPNYNGRFKSLAIVDFHKFLNRIYHNTYFIDASHAFALTKEDHEYIISKYDFGIYSTDIFIQELIEELKKLNLLNKTIVIFHGIHGEELEEHGFYGHYDVFDSEVKNAFIFYNPRMKNRMARISSQIQGIDLLPTLLETLNLPPLPQSQGKSVLPLLRGEEMKKRVAFIERTPLWEEIVVIWDKLYSKDFRDLVHSTAGETTHRDTAIRTNDWKLIHRTSRDIEKKISWWKFISGIPANRAEYELYNLQNDPSELKNVYDENPLIAEQLKNQLLSWENQFPLYTNLQQASK